MLRRVTVCLVVSIGASVAAAQAQQTGQPFDVRAYLERDHIISMYREWIRRKRPKVVWGVVQNPPAEGRKGQEDAAWRQIERALRGIPYVREEELDTLISAICLACRSAIETDDLLVQARAAGMIDRLCIAVQRRLIGHPEHHLKVPLEKIEALVACKDIAPLREHLTRFEKRLVAKYGRSLMKPLVKERIRAEGATMPASAPSDHHPQWRDTAPTSAPAASGLGVTVQAIERDAGNTVEGLFARSWRAMGMPPSDGLYMVAWRVQRNRLDPSGEQNEPILLAKLVSARASAVALRAIWEMCKSADRVPLEKGDFLKAARKIHPALRQRFRNIPAQCLSPEWIWKAAGPSIIFSQPGMRMPSLMRTTTRPANDE